MAYYISLTHGNNLLLICKCGFYNKVNDWSVVMVFIFDLK